VYKVSGIYKAEDKLYLLADGCGRRMKQVGVRSPREYWDKLTAQPSRDGKQRELLNEITIGEICLFRSQPQLDALRKVILPETVTRKTNDTIKRLRIWSAGCSTVGQKFSEKLGTADHEKVYMSGLMHDIEFMVNCLVFSREFAAAMERAFREEIPLDEAERVTRGFTHCETGALAEQRKLADDVVEVIAHHHAVEQSQKAQPLVAQVHLSDLPYRMRGLGYGYYERHKVDLVSDPAWAILLKRTPRPRGRGPGAIHL
jgi:hypothetical protein